MISKGFYEYLETIAEERRLDKQDVLAAVEIALIKAAQAEGHTGIIEVEFNDEQKKVRISETFNVVEEINDNAENKLNTLSNNKIIEFEEYANQVLEKIDINHKEVMFLYDMLNDKVESVKSVVSDLEKARLECVELNLGSKKISKDSSVEDINNVVADNELDEDFIELLNSCSDIEEARGDILDDNMEEISIASVLSEEGAGHYSNNVVEDNNKSKMNDYQKRSEQIIKLYSLGYSTVDISKKLGIGTGEVALINNLYHDRMVVVD